MKSKNVSGTKKNFCQECGKSSFYHLRTWLDELVNCFLPSPKFSLPIYEKFLNVFLEKIFVWSHLVRFRDDFTSNDIQLRSFCFLEEAKKQGLKCEMLYGPFGYTGQIRIKKGKKFYRFEGLPRAEIFSKYPEDLVDDKKKTKEQLQKGGFPTPEGRTFWFWEKKKALKYGMEKLGAPLMVKPRGGSFSRHVTCNINNSVELKEAIDRAIKCSPTFIVERFLRDICVFRATVVDFDFVACCERAPANVVGDGKHSIEELIKIKNAYSFRGSFKGIDTPLCKITADKTTQELLKKKNYNLTTVPSEKEIVRLQKDPFWRLGADVIEVTEKIHPDNLKLFKDVAKAFDIRLVGIDFLVKDISSSWKNQISAIIELNSLPCIELHHFPSEGKPRNVAKSIVDMFLKYYL